MIEIVIEKAGDYYISAHSTYRCNDTALNYVGTRLAYRIDNNTVEQLGVRSFSSSMPITGASDEYCNNSNQYLGRIEANTRVVLQACASGNNAFLHTGSLIAQPL